ncbi:hypothetical protein JW756_04245 [Candidatus Woesearchaeota archaeon]|nr:hypothetical protein [Candidatus Woesearchaeota archaeon]
MIKNKKGVVFTVLAIVISALFIAIFSARIERPVDYKLDVIETRISVLNDYMNIFYDYAEQAGSIAGYSALQAMLLEMDSRDRYYNRTDEFISNYTYCIKYGNITPSQSIPWMDNKSMIEYLDVMKNTASDQLNINSAFLIQYINVTQTTDAFEIKLLISISLNISDSYAYMADTRVITSTVTINGLQDPLYLMNDIYNQTINRTSIQKSGGEIGGNWSPEDLKQMYYNHEYRYFYDGVSFINRMKGNFSSGDAFGIESFVNHTHPGILAITNDNQSMADYLFWQRLNMSCTKEIYEIINYTLINSSGSPRNFQLDYNHIKRFNISSMDVTFACSS